MIFLSAVCLSFIGKYTRSLSTESRGKFCTNKFVSVPPFKAKQSYSAISGNSCTNN